MHNFRLIDFQNNKYSLGQITLPHCPSIGDWIADKDGDITYYVNLVVHHDTDEMSTIFVSKINHFLEMRTLLDEYVNRLNPSK